MTEHHTPDTMADKTPPRNGLILLFTSLAVMTLLGLEPIFRSYFQSSIRSAQQELVMEPEELLALRAKDRRLLEENPPLEQTLHKLQHTSSRGEAIWAARRMSDAISPQPSEDMDALRGWTLVEPGRERIARFSSGTGALLTAGSPEEASASALANQGAGSTSKRAVQVPPSGNESGEGGSSDGPQLPPGSASTTNAIHGEAGGEAAGGPAGGPAGGAEEGSGTSSAKE